MAIDSLASIITPKLLLDVYNTYIDYPKGMSHNWAELGDLFFNSTPERLKTIYKLIFPAMKALSKISLAQALSLDLTQYLPPPSAQDYPEQAIGLLFLLDGGPRDVLDGYGLRYVYGFFDPLAEKLALQFQSLPSHLRPHRKGRWLSQGYTVEDWAIRQVCLWVSLVHSERVMREEPDRVRSLLEHLRDFVESYTGVVDWNRQTDKADEEDLFLFPKMAREGPPTKGHAGGETRMEDYTYFMIRLIRCHLPIVRKFGRYPYRNPVLGRESTEEEKEYVKGTGNFAVGGNEELWEKVARDVKEGRWEELPRNQEYE
ncbi:MAG: hypothetical protein Q9160_006262 [Pyrenula sp. 1 TL-2023]